MIEKTYNIKGMHCASCASNIENTLKTVAGVSNIYVNYGTEKVKIKFDPNTTNINFLSSTIEKLGYSLYDNDQNNNNLQSNNTNESKKQKLLEIKKLKLKVIYAIPIAIISGIEMFWMILAKYNIVPMMNDYLQNFFHHLLPILATYILFFIGKPYLLGFYRFIKYRKANMDTLIGIGTVFAFLYSFSVRAFEELLSPFINVDYQYYDVTIVVITFITLGKYLEARSKIKTGDAIEKLLNLQAKTAFIIRKGQEQEISINDVQIGDLIVIKPGSKIPVDGVIIKGDSFVDESVVTGEPMPVKKKIGDNVVSGTINTNGHFIFKAEKIGSETLLSQIIKMVEQAQNSKAPIQALADKISAIFVPVVIIIAFLTLIIWISVGSYYVGFSQALSLGLVSFVGILVIACPCALGLATPTAVIVGVGKGAKEGILIKDAETLQKLHNINTIVVDKTGTITKGKPSLVDIVNLSDIEDNKFISIITSLESKSEHPIANAIVNYAKENNIEFLENTEFESLKGKGLRGVVDGVEYFVGNTKIVKELELSFDFKKIDDFTIQGKTPVIVSTRKKIIGFVMVADELKEESKKSIEQLHKMNIKVVMLTGDDEKTANYIASLVGIDQVIAHVLPNEKMNKIKELQSDGKIVAMAGDGVNDAPALAQADIGIAMGTGTDVAIESSSITLLGGDISKIVKAIKLSKITMLGIKQNLFWAFIYNLIGIPLASGLFYPFFGWVLNPVFAGFAMAMSSISVVSNSLRIKSKKI